MKHFKYEKEIQIFESAIETINKLVDKGIISEINTELLKKQVRLKIEELEKFGVLASKHNL